MRPPAPRSARARRVVASAVLATLVMALPAIAAAAQKPRVVSIAIAPSELMPQGVVADLHAIATYSDSSIADVTPSVRWSSSDDAVASGGRAVVTHTMGTATITAKWKSFSASTTVTVADALVSITVSPPPFIYVYIGASTGFSALGNTQAGPQVDVMPYAQWASGDTSVAPVDANGVATCLNQGDAWITAQLGTATGSSMVRCILPPA